MTEISLTANVSGAPASAHSDPSQPTLKAYAIVASIFLVFGTALEALIRLTAHEQATPTSLLRPASVLVSLIGVVWLLMVGFRNYAILRGIADANYYLAYKNNAPSDWIERPARVFNNLMQTPLLFFAVCALMMASDRLDAAQLWLAWIFVATRVLHALVYIGWNHLPTRFCCWNLGMITLLVIFARFAKQAWPSLV